MLLAKETSGEGPKKEGGRKLATKLVFIGFGIWIMVGVANFIFGSNNSFNFGSDIILFLENKMTGKLGSILLSSPEGIFYCLFRLPNRVQFRGKA